MLESSTQKRARSPYVRIPPHRLHEYLDTEYTSTPNEVYCRNWAEVELYVRAFEPFCANGGIRQATAACRSPSWTLTLRRALSPPSGGAIARLFQRSSFFLRTGRLRLPVPNRVFSEISDSLSLSRRERERKRKRKSLPKIE